jgi:flagellar biosynthesis protein FlhB
MLRTTPEEQREDRRVMEGDVTARAQRRRIARAWRGDSPDLLAGASLALHGPGGLTVILSGGPPPRRVMIRATARTAAGLRLRRSAEAARIPSVEDTELTRRLAQHHAAGHSIPAELIAELAAIWSSQAGG